jgi:hypothetical protein
MKKWARLDEEAVVVEILVEGDNLPGVASLDSIETSGLIEIGEEGNPGQYASVGFSYLENLKGFVPPKVFDSWELNEETFEWEAPEPMPKTGVYFWDESSKQWVNA